MRHQDFPPGSKRSSSGWTACGEPTLKSAKTQQSAGKFMASFFLCAWDNIYRLPWEGRSRQQRLLHNIIGLFVGELRGKTAQCEEKSSAVSSKQHRVTNQWKQRQNRMNWVPSCVRIHCNLRIQPQRLFSLLRPQDNARWKKIGANEEVIAETEGHFETNDESYYKNYLRMTAILIVSPTRRTLLNNEI